MTLQVIHVGVQASVRFEVLCNWSIGKKIRLNNQMSRKRATIFVVMYSACIRRFTGAVIPMYNHRESSKGQSHVSVTKHSSGRIFNSGFCSQRQVTPNRSWSLCTLFVGGLAGPFHSQGILISFPTTCVCVCVCVCVGGDHPVVTHWTLILNFSEMFTNTFCPISCPAKTD